MLNSLLAVAGMDQQATKNGVGQCITWIDLNCFFYLFDGQYGLAILSVSPTQGVMSKWVLVIQRNRPAAPVPAAGKFLSTGTLRKGAGLPPWGRGC